MARVPSTAPDGGAADVLPHWFALIIGVQCGHATWDVYEERIWRTRNTIPRHSASVKYEGGDRRGKALSPQLPVMDL